MDKIISDFGVQPVYLAAQTFNFLILLWILNKFLYAPILKVLEQRKNMVTESLEKTRTIDQRFQSVDDEAAKRLEQADIQAKKIIEQAHTNANHIIDDAHKQAQQDIKKMTEQGKREVEHERQQMKNEMRAQLASLVVLGIDKVSGKLVEETDHQKIVDQTIDDLKGEISD